METISHTYTRTHTYAHDDSRRWRTMVQRESSSSWSVRLKRQVQEDRRESRKRETETPVLRFQRRAEFKNSDRSSRCTSNTNNTRKYRLLRGTPIKPIVSHDRYRRRPRREVFRSASIPGFHFGLALILSIRPAEVLL